MELKLNQAVWYKKAKKKAIIKELLPNGLIRITYFDPVSDKRQIKDVLREDLDKLKSNMNRFVSYLLEADGRKKRDTILFAKVRPDAIIPTKRHEDGCYDVYANFEEDELVIESGEVVLVPTGIASSFSPKYRFDLARERGSTGKVGLQVLSGQIDSGYRGEWFVALHNSTNSRIKISKHVSEVSSYYGDKEKMTKTIIYPYSKAICQAALEIVPNVFTKEISYEELEKIPSARGKSKLGQSGK